MSESSPTPREFVEAFVPGLFRAQVALLSLGAALASGLLVVLALTLHLDLYGRGALAAGALAAWGHGAAWLTNGEVESGPAALANFAGAKWIVWFGLWWSPVAFLWIALGSLAQEAL